jgi:hypothetical protein
MFTAITDAVIDINKFNIGSACSSQCILWTTSLFSSICHLTTSCLVDMKFFKLFYTCEFTKFVNILDGMG